MKKSKIIALVLSINLGVQTEAIELIIPVTSYIINNQNSSTIAIETSKFDHLAVYNSSTKKFNDVIMPFRVISPKASTAPFDMKITNILHQCDGNDIEVITKLDNTIVTQGYEQLNQIYASSSNTASWTDFQFSLIFPIMNKTSVQQECSGRITLQVGLKV